MNVTELSQIVHSPDDKSEEIDRLLKEAADKNPDPPMTFALALQMFLGRLFHPMIHTWVRMQQYDKNSGRLIETGYLVCAYCTETRQP